jgi:hypothetical protein
VQAGDLTNNGKIDLVSLSYGVFFALLNTSQ